MHVIDAATRQLVDIEELQAQRRSDVSVASFAGFDAEGRFLVEVSGCGDPLVALSTIDLEAADIGAPVALARQDGRQRPIIIGRLLDRPAPRVAGIRIDGERLVIRADREIELCCGDASIVLTRAGKVLIRGNYVVSRARGANKIKGAFVDIN